ncbi:MAG: carbon storage regulator [Planctomycetia bacterium]|nr:carbon storage regulator [Planctomycetia bacterium]
MLVLSRKHGEQIELSMDGQLVTVAVVRIETGRVRIGIEAPANIGVRRKELCGRRRTDRPVARNSVR